MAVFKGHNTQLEKKTKTIVS